MGYFISKRGEMQSVTWLQHYANTNPAAAVAELDLKPDLGPLVEPHTAAYSVIACTATVSKQFYDDFGDWAQTIPHEIQVALIDAENDEVLNGNGEAPHMLGLLNQPNTLSRTCPTVTGVDYTAIDCLVDAIDDIRVAPGAYAIADLAILNPADWTAIKKIKNSLGGYVLNADQAMQVGEVDNIFGTPVATTTKMPVGTAIVLDTKIAVLAFLRWGLEILFDPWGDWAFSHNAVQFRGEIRETSGVAYPAAINLVGGLNYQGVPAGS
jgi:HK97 family phage major capsid protein